MKKKYSEDEYRFAAAKISAKACRLPGESAIEALCDAPSSAALRERLAELGITSALSGQDVSTEALLTAFLGEKYAETAAFLPDEEVCRLMQARFDCHNLKTAVKCLKSGADPSPYVIDSGSVRASDIAETVRLSRFDRLPDTLAKAAKAAAEAYLGGAAARSVDTMLDNACFVYMTELSRSLGCTEVTELLSLKADFTNALTVLRILKIRNPETAEALLADSLVPGGRIGIDLFREKKEPADIAALLVPFLNEKRAALLRAAVSENAGNDRLSSLLDTFFYSAAVDTGRKSQLGIYPVIGYLFRLEYTVKNIRILSCGLDAGYSADRLREEIRCYV